MTSPETHSPRRNVFLPALVSLALFFSGFFVVLTPLPFVYAFLKSGKAAFRDAIIPALGMVIILYAILLVPLHAFYTTHPQWRWLLPVPGMNFLTTLPQNSVIVFGVGYFLFYAVTGFVIAKILIRKTPSFSALGLNSAFFASLAILFYTLACYSVNLPPYQTLHNTVSSSFKSVLDELASSQALSLGQIAYIKENLESIVTSYILVCPSLLFCGALLVGAINLFLSCRLFSPFFFQESRMAWINDWRFSFKGVWLVILGLGLLLSALYLLPSSLVTGLSLNILITMAFIYYLQGLTLVSYFLDKKAVGPFGRIIVYSLLILLFQTLGPMIVMLGFSDAWIDFRKVASEPKKGVDS